jgi:hypothetical protein
MAHSLQAEGKKRRSLAGVLVHHVMGSLDLEGT